MEFMTDGRDVAKAADNVPEGWKVYEAKADAKEEPLDVGDHFFFTEAHYASYGVFRVAALKERDGNACMAVTALRDPGVEMNVLRAVPDTWRTTPYPLYVKIPKTSSN